MPTHTRREALWSAAGALTLLAPSARAQDAARYPDRNVTIMVPFGAGGPPDVVARVIASGLTNKLGKPFIVENRPGANTALAAGAVMRAPPDGHTLMAVDISYVVTPYIASNLGVDPLKDFKCVGLSAKSVFTLMVSPALGAKSVADFVALAKSRPEAVKIGHTGVGTTPHLAAITFAKATGTQPLLVPYRTVSDAVTNTMSGDITAVFSAASTAMGPMKDGRIVVLGVTGEKRAAAMPDVPTFAENGIAMTGFEDGSWYGLVAPAATPDDIVAKLNAALVAVTRDDEARSRLAVSGVELSGGTPQAFRDFVARQYTYWGDTLRAAGVKADAP